MEYDNIHWQNLTKLMSYNKPFIEAISGRGPGKTTDVQKFIWNDWKKRKHIFVIVKRLIKDVHEAYIQDLENGFNRFLPENERIKFKYAKKSLDDGIVDIKIEGHEEPFIRICALSNPLERLKGQCFLENNLRLIWFDEHKINRKLGEKYLPSEWQRFQELYSTLTRFSCGNLQCVFTGNNYSITDPYTAGLKVDVKAVRVGEILVGDKYVFEDIKLTPELRQWILDHNPLFDFGEDDAYTKYALDGMSVDDQRIKIIEKHPQNYKLQYVFNINNSLCAVYINNRFIMPNEDVFWVEIIEKYDSERRDIFCFNVYDLFEGNVLLNPMMKSKFAFLCECFRRRKMSFKDVNAAFAFEQVYCSL